ncbi:MAG: twin-arginine translocation signal domain-containing protein [Proteobacteria bacterium]|nr:twin-arginine translocation signal domain-containing protein [Pseudomonadota bacterium]
MSQTAEGTAPQGPAGDDSQTRRDFLTLATVTVGAAGAGLAVAAVVDADDGEILGRHGRHRGQRADVHQHLAVAGNHRHVGFRGRKGDA